jgi:hypothetical protein
MILVRMERKISRTVRRRAAQAAARLLLHEAGSAAGAPG